jgi:2-polyprenyl-3-methyl-5-hydroxy-6-metoxy-1,4-benzoquinol methylase
MQRNKYNPSFSSERLKTIAEIEEDHFWFRGRLQLISDLIHRRAPVKSRVLDIGCGTGSLVKRLTSEGYEAIGMDIFSLTANNPQDPIRFVTAESTSLPFTDTSFDMVTLIDVMEHTDDIMTIREVSRVLKTGAILIATVPAVPCLWSYRDTAAGHRRRYTRKRIIHVLANSGIELIDVRYYQFILFPFVAVSRLLGRRRSSFRDVEDHPASWINRLFMAVNQSEVFLGRFIPYPWGSSMAFVGRKK